MSVGVNVVELSFFKVFPPSKTPFVGGLLMTVCCVRLWGFGPVAFEAADASEDLGEYINGFLGIKFCPDLFR